MKKAIADWGDFSTVHYQSDMSLVREPTLDAITRYVMTAYSDCKTQRSELERVWELAWKEYFSLTSTDKPTVADLYKAGILPGVAGGGVAAPRNRVSAGKIFEQVETAHAYLMSSLFPNKDWFKVNSLSHDDEDVALILTEYIKQKNVEWKFYVNVANYLRQLIVIGFSCMAVPYTNGKISYETLDVFDTYFDLSVQDIEDSFLMRRICLTKAEIFNHIDRGHFSNISRSEIERASSDAVGYEASTHGIVASYKGLSGDASYSPSDKIWALEFWGDVEIPGYGCLKDVVAIVLNGRVVRLQKNPSHSGKPFILSTYTPVIRQQAGIGLVQPILGMGNAANKYVNLLLDGGEVSVNPMYTLTSDEVLSDEELKFTPGKVLRVNNHDSLRPLQPPSNNYGVGIQNLQMLTDAVSRMTGVSSLLTSGYVRSGERVTATEITESRNAGGNRLLNVHTHIQNTFLYPLVTKVVRTVQQFADIDETLKVESKGQTYYLKIHSHTFQFDCWCTVSGAEHVIESNNELDKRLRLLDLMFSVPELKEKLNLDSLLEDILRFLNIGNPQKYLKQPDPQEEQGGETSQQTPSSQQVMLEDTAMQNTLEANQMADGGATLAAETFGIDKSLIEGVLNGSQSVPVGNGISAGA